MSNDLFLEEVEDVLIIVRYLVENNSKDVCASCFTQLGTVVDKLRTHFVSWQMNASSVQSV